MRTSQAARYARWSAAVALLLATVVSVVYARRAWQAHLAQRAMHPSVPSSVQQQTAGFSLSKVTGDHTEFTVRASHATEFTEGGRSVLQDVWFTAYGQDGQRFDNLHTRSCDYLEHTGDIICGGDVQIDLESAEDARLHPSTPSHADPGAQVVHIETSGLSFNRTTGLATTDQPVTFHFPQGEGHAIGFRYDSEMGELRLIHSVEMTLHASGTAGRSGVRRAAPCIEQQHDVRSRPARDPFSWPGGGASRSAGARGWRARCRARRQHARAKNRCQRASRIARCRARRAANGVGR